MTINVFVAIKNQIFKHNGTAKLVIPKLKTVLQFILVLPQNS